MRNACDMLLLGKHVALDGELGAEGTQTSFPSLPRMNFTSQLEGGGEAFCSLNARVPPWAYWNLVWFLEQVSILYLTSYSEDNSQTPSIQKETILFLLTALNFLEGLDLFLLHF